MTGSDKTPLLVPEFSRSVAVVSLQGDRVTRQIVARDDECRALAVRFGLVSVDGLSATVQLTRLHGFESGMVRVKGTLTAQVVQTCVVSLEPVAATVCESFSALFAPDVPEFEPDVTLDPFAPDEDCPEPLIDGEIDIGELTAQHLSLALDPYPRVAGLEFCGFADEEQEPAPERASPSPFAALRTLKRHH